MKNRIRIRGHWRWVGPVFVRLWRIHPLLAWALVWPICKLALVYWVDGEKI